MLRQLFSGGLSAQEIIIHLISIAVVLLFVMPVHEWAHGFVAVKLGDYTPKFGGRLSLNPLAHIDPFGAIMMVLFGVGWAKPVHINPRNFKNPKIGMAITAAAGPIANLIMALICSVISNIFIYFIQPNTVTGLLYTFFATVSYYNVALAAFNLVPIPPLDGSRIWSIVLPDSTYYKLMQYERYIGIVLLAVIYFGVLDRPLAYVNIGFSYLVDFIADLPFKLIFLFI